MVDRIPAFNDEGLLDRVRMAAQDAELGGHREVFVRMLPRIRGETVICGLLTAGLAVAAVALTSEMLTRTDQTGGKVGNVMGLLCVAPFALLFGFAFVVNLYKSLFGPATSSCSWPWPAIWSRRIAGRAVIRRRVRRRVPPTAHRTTSGCCSPW